MNWKEFFRPNKTKFIILTIIVVLFVLFIFYRELFLSCEGCLYSSIELFFKDKFIGVFSPLHLVLGHHVSDNYFNLFFTIIVALIYWIILTNLIYMSIKKLKK